MKNRNLIVSIVSNLLASIIGLLTSLVLTKFLTESVGKETYSFYAISNNITSYIAVVTVALNSMASRFMTIAIAESNEKAQKYYSTLVYSNLLLSVLVLIIGVIISQMCGVIFDIPNGQLENIKALFLLIFISFCINMVSSIFSIAMFVKERIDLVAYENIFTNILKIILYCFIFINFSPNIIFVGVATLLTTIFSAVYRFFCKKKLLPNIVISKKGFEFGYLIELVTSGIWNSISSLGNILISASTVMLANILINSGESGDLAISQTLIVVISTFMSSINSVLYPKIANIYVNHKKELASTVELCQSIQNIIMIPLFFVIILMSRSFFAIWLPSENKIKLTTLSVLSLVPYFFQNFSYSISNLNIMNNRIKVQSMLMVALGIFSVSISFVLLKIARIGVLSIILPEVLLLSIYYLLFIPKYVSIYNYIDLKKMYLCIFKSSVLFVFVLCISSSEIVKCYSWISLFVYSALFYILLFVLSYLLILDKHDRLSIKNYFKSNIIKK